MSSERPFVHIPVLVDRVVELFAAVPAGTIVDATLGGGGHAAALLESRPDIAVLGIDRDPSALVAARSRLAAFEDRVTTAASRFDAFAEVVSAVGGAGPIVGFLFDLGVSSAQFDAPERGFSYRFNAPLDMRMDPGAHRSAADVVNDATEQELAAILADYGDERFARRIAANLVAARGRRPIRTTVELAELVTSAIPAATRRRGGHPAKRTFQALRIEVNDELAILPKAIDAAIDLLTPGGRGVAISYHSGEDRIVKARLRHAEDGGCTCPPGLPCVCGAQPQVRLIRRGGETPGATEIERNPRAGSARLRAAEKLSAVAPEWRPR